MAKITPVYTKEVWAQQTTTNNYATLGQVWDVKCYKTINLLLKNTHASNSATVRVLGSLDDGDNYDVVVGAEQTITAGGTLQVKVADYYTHLKIEVKATTTDQHATIIARGCAIGA